MTVTVCQAKQQQDYTVGLHSESKQKAPVFVPLINLCVTHAFSLLVWQRSCAQAVNRDHYKHRHLFHLKLVPHAQCSVHWLP
jgi:hypothetical protein